MEAIDGKLKVPIKLSGVRKHMVVVLVPRFNLILDFMKFFGMNLLTGQDQYLLADKRKNLRFMCGH